MTAFPKAAVRESRVKVDPNVRFWPKADIQILSAGSVYLSRWSNWGARVESHHRLPESQLRPVGESSEQR